MNDEALKSAERTVRSWHKVARHMCDLAVAGDCRAIEMTYYDAALSLPFYGADPDPLPSEFVSKVQSDSFKVY